MCDELVYSISTGPSSHENSLGMGRGCYILFLMLKTLFIKHYNIKFFHTGTAHAHAWYGLAKKKLLSLITRFARGNSGLTIIINPF